MSKDLFLLFASKETRHAGETWTRTFLAACYVGALTTSLIHNCNVLFRHEYSGAACGREEHDVPPDPRPLAPERRLQAQDETGQEEQAEVTNLNTVLVVPVFWIRPHWFWSAGSGSRRAKITHKARKSLTLHPLVPERRLYAQEKTGQEEQAEVSNVNIVQEVSVLWILLHWYWSAGSGSRRAKFTRKVRKSLTPALLQQSFGYRLRMKQGRKSKQRWAI